MDAAALNALCQKHRKHTTMQSPTLQPHIHGTSACCIEKSETATHASSISYDHSRISISQSKCHISPSYRCSTKCHFFRHNTQDRQAQ
ncbi:TPA: hypothetical protein ACH3X2_14321 [Trebouxia sp. C0005]